MQRANERGLTDSLGSRFHSRQAQRRSELEKERSSSVLGRVFAPSGLVTSVNCRRCSLDPFVCLHTLTTRAFEKKSFFLRGEAGIFILLRELSKFF